MRTVQLGLAALLMLMVQRVTLAAEPPAVGEKAADFELASPDGQKMKLSEVNAHGPVVLVVLRGYPGYQCPLCTKQVAELRKHADDFAGRGAKVLLVYPGPADGLDIHAKEFIGAGGMPEGFVFVTDPDFTFTNAYHLRWDAPNETAYPSTFVINKTGTIAFAKVSKGHGDRAKADELLKVLETK